MAKGGSRAFSGPPPDPNALRRDRDGADWTILPASGRDGDIPEWPLTVATNDERAEREAELWARQWTRPQAIVWEANGQEDEVALFVRAFADAESPKSPVAARQLVKQLQETLGISLPGMLRLRWKIEANTPAATDTRPAPAAGSARSRLKVVDGGG